MHIHMEANWIQIHAPLPYMDCDPDLKPGARVNMPIQLWEYIVLLGQSHAVHSDMEGSTVIIV